VKNRVETGGAIGWHRPSRSVRGIRRWSAYMRRLRKWGKEKRKVTSMCRGERRKNGEKEGREITEKKIGITRANLLFHLKKETRERRESRAKKEKQWPAAPGVAKRKRGFRLNSDRIGQTRKEKNYISAQRIWQDLAWSEVIAKNSIGNDNPLETEASGDAKVKEKN